MIPAAHRPANAGPVRHPPMGHDRSLQSRSADVSSADHRRGSAQPVVGTAVLALYGAALAGIGFAVAGLWRSSVGAPVVFVVAVATLLLDIIVPVLRLPDWVHDLALTTRYAEPMLGNWDPVGIVVSLGLAFGGLALGAWGFARRHLRG